MKPIYKEVTNQIIQSLEKGVKPWDCPWIKPVASRSLPFNVNSNKSYSGINVLVLWLERLRCCYGTNGWFTFKQIQASHGFVQKGEHGCRCIYYSIKEVKANDSEEVRSVPFIKSFIVFNVDQVEGGKFDLPDIPKFDLNSKAEQVVKAAGVEIRVQGSQAKYNITKDCIVMPPKSAFSTAEGYYSTLFHELVHATGHKTRLNRFEKSNKFGDSEAFEELVAELGSAFLCAELGITNNYTNHASYIDSWLQLLKSNEKAIFIAASLASKAHKFILPCEIC